ncbi:AfsR/SARP family transcriptional regulator [Micromonospora endolithica]|uniref:AfsR/SARP family transcriptional regulator n=1 Tax=Micromonospora endolithica TaxID=230091 RepID=UPI0013159707|nr:bacterial transcriptional activator domain-containing protein [Micromonospora endolithica]
MRTDAQYLCLDAAVSCDLHELRVEAEAWQQWAADRRQPQRRRLDGPGTAVHLHELCRDLLPGWYDDWVLAERDALQRIRVPLLRHLARTYKEAGEYGNALQAALHLVDMDPLDEQAQDMLIRIHVAEGNLVEARRAYTAYHSRLTAELGMTPPAALRRLAYPPANE